MQTVVRFRLPSTYEMPSPFWHNMGWSVPSRGSYLFAPSTTEIWISRLVLLRYVVLYSVCPCCSFVWSL